VVDVKVDVASVVVLSVEVLAVSKTLEYIEVRYSLWQ
jgi:hypothetical protein